MEHTHFVSVAGLVRNSRGHLLLVNSPRRRWEYPGGMEVAWFSPEDALEAVTFPLTRHRPVRCTVSASGGTTFRSRMSCFCPLLNKRRTI